MTNQSCQIWPFQTKKQIWPFFKKLVGLEFFDNLLSSCPNFRSKKVSIVKFKTLPFLKQRLAVVSCKHQATLGPNRSRDVPIEDIPLSLSRVAITRKAFIKLGYFYDKSTLTRFCHGAAALKSLEAGS